jgi:4-hydroxymandelate oxidase
VRDYYWAGVDAGRVWQLVTSHHEGGSPVGQPVDIEELEAAVHDKLEQRTFDYIAGGAGAERTVRANRAAFARRFLLPRVLVGVAERDLSTALLGTPLSMPVILAPTGAHGLVHPDGEVETVRGAAVASTLMAVSGGSTMSLEEIARAASPRPRLWHHLYFHPNRAVTEWLIERAQQAGYSALVVTADAPVLGRRDRDLRNNLAPLQLRIGNYDSLPPGVSEIGDSTSFVTNPGLTWTDVTWLRSRTTLPVVVKGILRPDDAVRAVDAGADAVWVSNHGGRQLDGAVATLDALPAVVAALDGRVPVIQDGGVRRGTDVLVALALGAAAVAVGRPQLWGLAMAGADGVQHVLRTLRDELSIAMALAGCRSIRDVDTSLIA